ncbi:LexA-binding, inner membrane-associated putative hydrolase [Haloactinopolyspora alba]|uniref:LexA-binding, inner membrane-associated putative hydrolase n=1 Tax=Haloactinopolyspora alba TaxID=648780 RepID=A0A2P8DEZ2_9ACTN|nr:metal-dependent hydrolase [Haloactinopolyspora alba]PSK95796.1 LexA-binding, inner membrane-associated putative hydrolase [Haloactinopolyspora alba]
MLAHTHALTGAAAWLALAPVVHADRPAELAGGTVMAAGAALLPDLDHHSGTAAKTWGPITRLIGRVTAWACGGHRKGTHTLLAAAAAGGVTYLAVNHAGWAAVAVVALLVGLALVACEDLIPGRWERFWPANLAASVGLAFAAVATDLDLTWLPAAVAIGWAAHLAGDFVTDGGVPLLAPLTSRRFRLTYLNTGGRWETVVAWTLTASIAALAAATIVTMPEPWTTAWPDNQQRLDKRLDGM